MANMLGKRFLCGVCGTQVLCTKAGQGGINCCDEEMALQQPKAIPSAD